jgi:hypothetical protein
MNNYGNNNWNIEQHKAYAAEAERRARQQQQANEARREERRDR